MVDDRLSSGLVEEVYLVRFENVIFGGGGVQYQQTSNASSTAGWFDFIGVTQESSATPLLDIQVILPPAPGVSNEGPRSRVLVPLPAVSWPWVPAWGSLEPPRQDGENAQKTGKNGGKMGEIRPRSVNQGS